MKNSLKYLTFGLGTTLLIFNEIFFESSSFFSVIGIVLLIVGLYWISKGIGEKPEYNPYAVQSEDEEE